MRFRLIILALFLLLFANQTVAVSFEEYSKNKEEQFKKDVKKNELAYKNAVEMSEAEFKRFVKKAEDRWGKYTSSNVKEWVTYSGDADVISIANLSDQGKYPGSIIVKALVDIPKRLLKAGKISAETEIELRKIAQNKLAMQLSRVISDKNPKTGEQTFVNQAKLGRNRGESIASAIKRIPGYVKNNTRIVRKPRLKKSGGYQREYQIKVDLVPNHLQRRAKVYLPQISELAEKNNIPPSFILAIIQTESFFNPHACSRPRKNTCLAYGLMQLVPKSGAREAYRFLYKKDRIVSGSYLFNSQNNLTLGSAYLGKMVNRDFRNIDSREKRYILAASSYNTGHGNTAKGMMKITNTRTRYPRPTIKVITREANRLEFDELLERLKIYLPYEETRHYVEKVHRRKNTFRPYDG